MYIAVIYTGDLSFAFVMYTVHGNLNSMTWYFFSQGLTKLSIQSDLPTEFVPNLWKRFLKLEDWLGVVNVNKLILCVLSKDISSYTICILSCMQIKLCCLLIWIYLTQCTMKLYMVRASCNSCCDECLAYQLISQRHYYL